jgi:hypothetical protein
MNLNRLLQTLCVHIIIQYAVVYYNNDWPYLEAWYKMLFSLYVILLKHYWETYYYGFREKKPRYEIQERNEVPVWYTGI